VQPQSSTYGHEAVTANAMALKLNSDIQSYFTVPYPIGLFQREAVHTKGNDYGARNHVINNFLKKLPEESSKIPSPPNMTRRECLARSPFDPELETSPPSTAGPIKLVRSILTTWKLQPKDALPLLGYEATQWPHVRDLLNGYGTLSGRDVKDRIACLFEVRRNLSGLFKDKEVENDWLRETHSILNDQKPLELLLEGSIENLLLVKDYVELAAGR